mmetsp:Transcript_123895/g.344837  ORF Transcript_123895/g.344837 Transcript_123895/m.344837 type:complete len:289 (+) Transcript_123895:654-1520(+)
MRSSSPGNSGLWSSDSSTAFPLRQSTARESPQFATVRRRGRTAAFGCSTPSPSLSMRATMAVLPTKSKALLLSEASKWLAIRPNGPATDALCVMLEPPLRRKESIVSIARWSALPISWAVTCEAPSFTASVVASLSSLSTVSSASALASAAPSLDLLKFIAHAASTFGNSLEAMSETCAPPCPSKTPKRAWFESGVGKDATTHVASSMAGRQPCISADAHSSSVLLPPSVFFCRRGARTGPPPLSTHGWISLAQTMHTVTVITPFRVKSCRRSLPGICSMTRMINKTT